MLRAILCLALAAGLIAAQTYEVASVKPAHDTAADPNLDSRPGGTVFATNITAGYLIRLAYGVQDYQIDRAPGWMDSAHFDITAKGAPASPNASKGAALENEKAH